MQFKPGFLAARSIPIEQRVGRELDLVDVDQLFRIRRFADDCRLRNRARTTDDRSMDIDGHVPVADHGTDDETGAMAKPVDELNCALLSEDPPLSCVRDAVQELVLVINCDCRPLDPLVLAIHNNHRRSPNFQPQPVCSIGVNEMK